ncbi:DUF7948 domain-containing protein [Taibaiella koreensis]|uniref:DUF7948 domain-containing protein n=1 Tax=Taibaiella koreensis TaxID=1268548 RepID=UPI000E59D6E0|nr:T9SS type A sorting domain-containing protein [Taibaiella koreensis]
MNKKVVTLLAGIMLVAAQGQARTGTNRSCRLTPTLSQQTHPVSPEYDIHSYEGFLENAGQVTDQAGGVRADIDFQVKGKGINIFIGNGAIHYQWATPRKEKKAAGTAPRFIDMYRMDVTLVNANTRAVVLREQQLPYFEQYLNSTGLQPAHAYQKVIYKNVYPHIDWVFYFNADGRLEHDFVVHPGGKVSDIRLQYGGATALACNQDGSLTATTPMGQVSETAPRSYTDKGIAIPSSFVLEGQTLGFRTASYTGTLTIDPTLAWGTFYGGTGDDFNPNLATDPEGNVYMSFATMHGSSAINIVTTGAYQTTRQVAEGDNSPFLVKFDSTGQRQWGTHFGHSSYTLYPREVPNLSCDPYGNVFILADTMIAKFNGAGQLSWTKGLPGYIEYVYRTASIQCDPSGNLYLTGNAYSGQNAVFGTAGTYKDTVTGDMDVFLMKYDSAGNRLWGTFFGGEGSEQNYVGFDPLACDAAGNVYLSGRTGSLTGIATPGSFQTTLGGTQDAFLAKFDGQGQLLWSTYYGGSGTEMGGSVVTDADNNVFLAAITNSTTGINSPNSFQDTLGGGNDFFIVKFNSSGTRQWATYYGGESEEWYNYRGGILGRDVSGNVVLYGFTSSPDGISTPGAYQESIMTGGYTVFMAKLNTLGKRLWGTYFGGAGGGQIGGYISFYGPNSAGGDISCDAFGNIYIANSAGPNAVVTTPNGYQPLWSAGNTNAGMHDVFLSKFRDCSIALPGRITGDTALCAGAANGRFYTTPAPGAVSYTWLLPSGWTGTSTADTIAVITNGSGGQIGVVAVAACGGTDTVWQNVIVRTAPAPVIVRNGNVLSTGTFSSYQWYHDGQPIAGATGPQYTLTATGSYTVKVSDSYGCNGLSAALQVTTLGLHDPRSLAEAIQVYPNPASKIVHISSPVKLQVRLSSIDGRKLLEIEEAATIDIGAYPEGLYLLQLSDTKGNLLKTVKLTRSR